MKELLKKYGTKRVFNAIFQMFVEGIDDDILNDITMIDILDYITSSRDFRKFLIERK